MAARLPYLDREQVPPDVQAVYDNMKKATGRVLNTFRLMAHHARSVAPFVAWYGTLRDGTCGVPTLLLERGGGADEISSSGSSRPADASSGMPGTSPCLPKAT